jgi:predicted DNA binding CopG/RHH family protein
MRAHYEFSKLRSRRNPYPKLLKQSVTIRLDRSTVQYFKDLADETGLPYQSLINLYLRDCAVHESKPTFEWVRGRRKRSAS